MDYTSLIREDLRNLRPYFPDRYKSGTDSPVWIDANENPYNTEWGRYPSPMNTRLQHLVGLTREFPADQVFLSHGSDEAIDLIIRAFCTPQKDAISVLKPAFEMYAHAARVAAVDVRSYQMFAPYQPNAALAEKILQNPTKVLFLCSPNNPTGNLMPEPFIRELLEHWPGMIVIDEAYIDFADAPSMIGMIKDHPNLIVMQTFSKAFGLAALRIGMTFAQKWIIDSLEAIKMPYNVSLASCRIAIDMLEKKGYPKGEIAEIKSERERMRTVLGHYPFVEEIYPSDANFLLVKCTDAEMLYSQLKNQGIFVRLRKERECRDCLRITIGTPQENAKLTKALNTYALKNQNQHS